MRDALLRLAREPLVHFALIGVGLFVVDGAFSQGDAPPSASDAVPPERAPIVVDETVRAALAEEWMRTRPAPPTAAELETLVERFIDEEVLYREGLARGLAENDPQIRTRVTAQMQYVLQTRVTVRTPDDAELRAWFEANTDRFAKPERIDFTQVFVAADDPNADARATELLHLLQGGADPDGLGDTFAGGRRFRGRRLEDLRARFGDTFAEGLRAQPEHAWTLLPSSHGKHVVRVDRRTSASTADFEAAREEVVHAWQEDARKDALSRETAALRERWEVVVAP